LKKRTAALIFVCLITLLFSFQLRGAEARQLTLADGIKLGLESSPAIQISNITLEKAVLQIKKAEAGLWPTVSLSAGGTYRPNNQQQSLFGSIDPTKITDPTTWTVLNNLGNAMIVPPPDPIFYTHSLDVTQAVFSQPIFKAYVISRLYYGQEKYNWEKRREDLIINIVNLYLNASRSQAAYQLALENRDQSAKYLKMTRAKYDLGLLPKTDLLRMEVNFETAKNSLSKTGIACQSSLLALKSMLGLDLADPIELADINTPAFSDLPEPKSMMEDALKKRSDYLSGEIWVRLAELNVSVNKGSYWPNLFLRASYGVSPPGDINKLTFDNDKFSLTLSFSWKIWDGGSTAAAVKDAGYTLQQAKISQDLSRKSIETELTQVYLNNIEIQQRLEMNQRALTLAKESLRLAERSYEEGLRNLLELDDARIALQTAQLNYLQAKFDAVTYDYNMRKARGILDPDGLTAFDKAHFK
jgi:outer membrane protein TolC